MNTFVKKIIAAALAIVMGISLVSCTFNLSVDTGPIDKDPDWLSGIKTLGDAFDLEDAESRSESISDGKFVYVFEKDGVYVRVYAEPSQEQLDAMDAIDFFDEERDAKTHDIIKGLTVSAPENLSRAIPTAEKLAGYAGKTGQNLMDDGFVIGYGWNLEDNILYMAKGVFDYMVYFNNSLTDAEDPSEEDIIAGIKDNTVKSVEFFGLSVYCDDLEYHD